MDRLKKPVWIASLVVSVVLLLLPSIFKLDGKPHADWQQFFGRFHPLVVHLPVGLILLVPLLEVAGRFRPALLEAAGFVLSLSVLSCLLALTLGYLLAYGSGDAGAGVVRHMWGGIAVTIAVGFCFFVRGASGSLRDAYPYLLAGAVLLLAWTAHQGGSLTHGDNYLTQYLPAPLKLVSFGSTDTKPQFPDSFYAQHIYPVLDANCVSCHGASKVKGSLRLDTYDRLMRGGEDGAVVIPGNTDRSTLLKRITLPKDDKKFMPSDGKPPLKPEEIAWIKAWIQQGASAEVKTLVGVNVPPPHHEEPIPQVGDYSAKMGEIAQAAKSAGVTLVPVSRNLGDGLILNTTDAGTKFGDAQLAGLARFAPYIVEAELARTSVSDACFDTLEKFSHLRALHLEGTAVRGVGLAKLGQLQQLRYLNLSGTQVTEAGIAPLRSMKNLRHLYLYDTPAQPAAR
jgi:Planctomycete cytochrome C